MKKTSLFLIELLCNLLLFALCAALCVGLLMHARSLSRQSGRLTDGVILAQSVAEVWRATGAAPSPGQPYESGLTYTLTPAGETATITVFSGDETIYTLEGVTRP